MAIHKAKDNSAKAILDEPEIFAAFLRDFVPLDILKGVSPEDIGDGPERLLSLIAEQKDGDTVKRINLKGDRPLFVIAIVEHQSKVNFRAPFKMLLYIALILDDYEKEANRKASKEAGKPVNVTLAKDFKYPPILPIIFYDGAGEWTAAANLVGRTEMGGIFEKYIPKFEYELVSLRDYSFSDLAEFGDVLSLFMIVDKLNTADAFGELGKLWEKYGGQFAGMHVPPHLKGLLAKAIAALLARINVPQDEIDAFVERFDERGISEMVAIENYNVQEVRRVARDEERRRAKEELREQIRRTKAEERRRAKEKLSEQRRRTEEERRRAEKSELLLKSAVKSLLDQGESVAAVAARMDIPEQEIRGMFPELA